MKIYNFENFGHNFLRQNRLVLKSGGLAHKDSTPHNDFRTGHFFKSSSGDKAKAGPEKGKGVSKAPQKPLKSPSTEKKLDEVKKDLDTGKKKIIITERARDKFKKGMGKEIYGGNEELREKYRDAVREAIEKMGRDKLYNFIKQHSDKSYNKGDYAQWNRDFAKLITPNMPKEYSDFKTASKETENIYLVGGLQQYLLDEFDTDVFQATVNKKNPFINVDGRLGAYTISVMAVHWNKEFQATDKKKRPVLNYGSLGEGYVSNRRNMVLYGDALAHLNAQVGGGSGRRRGSAVAKGGPKKGPKNRPSIKTGPNTMEAIRADLLDANASDGAIYAFDSAYDKTFIPAIRKIIKELKDEGVFARRDPKAWDKVHNRLANKNSPHYSQAYLDEYAEYEAENPDTTPALTPVLGTPAPTAPAKSKITKKETAKKKAEKLPKEDFIRGLRARINREDFDFNLWTWDEEEHREEFANKIYDLCSKYKIPLTVAVLDDVIKNLKIYSADGKSVDYGRKVFRLTDTQTAAQEAQNKRLISYLGRGLREKYLKEELPEEDAELMTKDAFIAEMITELDANDVDFQSWGFEYNARESFAKDAYKKCDKSKIPTSMNTVRHMVDKLIYEYMVADNDIEYFSDTTDHTEIASNNKILDEVTEGIA